MSRMLRLVHSVFRDCSLQRLTCQRTVTVGPQQKFAHHSSPISSGALRPSGFVLKRFRYRPAHGSPNSFATFPQTPLHRRVLIHLGVLEIFPGELLVGAELLIGP